MTNRRARGFQPGGIDLLFLRGQVFVGLRICWNGRQQQRCKNKG